ncbi:MAG: 2-oxo acid dehydrogenase subunit E2 [Phycisphaeraceae bacterium]|nr:2-oxo acid dehydrogenase subunit E2 [Phycisphaeraceae bacterium]
MAIRIEMPRLSDTMEEGTLLNFKVKVGDTVKAGDVLAEVETDKATMEVQSFDDGTVAELTVKEGDVVPVGSAMMVLAADGESVEDARSDSGKDKSSGGKKKSKKEDDDDEPEKDDESEEDDKPQRSESADSGDSEDDAPKEKKPEDDDGNGRNGDSERPSSDGRIRISPVARKIAEEMGVDIESIKGTGPDGRIIKRDVLNAGEAADKPSKQKASTGKGVGAISAPETRKTPAKLESRRISLNNMRKTIAKRLVESKTTIPHFQVCVDVDADRLLELRKTINEQLENQSIRLSVNDFIVRACASALEQHPIVNSSWDRDGIVQHGTVNIGVAVALPEEKGGGLVVPVLKQVEAMSVRRIHERTKELAEKARGSGLSLDEMADSTFTVSNLGMYGVTQFNAIINPPNVAILAIGAAIKQPVVRNDELAIGHRMNLTLSCDHRVVDGATGAEFLVTLKGMLEHPAVMLI